MPHTSLLSLPPELLLIVAELLPRRPLRALSQACAHLRSLLTCIVYADAPLPALLRFAATRNHPLLLRIALHRGAAPAVHTPKNQRLTAKAWAVIKYDNVLLALRLNASPDATTVERYTLATLHRAAHAGHAAIVRILLQPGPGAGPGVDAAARTSRGDTALHVAAERGHVAVAAALLECGAPVDAAGWKGCTPLHYAALQGDVGVASVLVAAGAGVGACNGNGAAPLHLAAWRGMREVVEFLVVCGAEVGARDAGGRTPLHRAAGEGHEGVVGVLVAAGADKAARDGEGRTAGWRARRGGHAEMAERLLRTRGARWSLVDYVFLKAFR